MSGGEQGRGEEGDAQMDVAAVEVIEKAVVDEAEGVGEDAFCCELVGKVEGGRVDEGERDESSVEGDEDVCCCEESSAASAGERMGRGKRVEEKTQEGGLSWWA